MIYGNQDEPSTDRTVRKDQGLVGTFAVISGDDPQQICNLWMTNHWFI